MSKPIWELYMAKYFKRPDRGFCPIYKDDTYIYRIEDERNRYYTNKDRRNEGFGSYLWKFVRIRKGRWEKRFSPEQFDRYVKWNNLQCTEYGEVNVYVDNLGKEYFLTRKDGEYTVAIKYQDELIADGFLSYKDCLKYAEEYIEKKNNHI